VKKSDFNTVTYGINPSQFLFPSMIFGNSWQAFSFVEEEKPMRYKIGLEFQEKIYMNTKKRPCLVNSQRKAEEKGQKIGE